MAKINQYPAKTVPSNNDEFVLHDPSSGSTKKMTYADMMAGIYPIGSIYINATVSTNPGSLLGFGTWEAFGTGRVPVGFDPSDSKFNAAEKTGGSSSLHARFANTTTLGVVYRTKTVPSWQASRFNVTSSGGSASDNVTTGVEVMPDTGSAGSMNPYITVYMWKRTG